MDFISQFAVSLDAIRGVEAGTIQYRNSHTHHREIFSHKDDSEDVIEVINRYPGEVCLEDEYASVGLHPWNVDKDWKTQLEKMRSEAFSLNVCAIGECGLDKCVEVDLNLQIEAFKAQVLLAEEVQKPMIIHCVRAFDELLAIHKEMKPKQKWLIHGFRGKPEQAKQIMAKGLLLSFGHQYNVSSLAYVALTCRSLYLETDDSCLSIRQIYDQVACHLASGSLD